MQFFLELGKFQQSNQSLFGSQRDPRCRESLAPRSYRISISKTRGLGDLQNSKDSLIPKVDMLGLRKNVNTLEEILKMVHFPMTKISGTLESAQNNGH
jgi:hypothetical protein